VSLHVWLILLGIIGVGVLAYLYTLAGALRHEVASHDLKVSVATLRLKYVQSLKEMHGELEEGEFDIIEDEPGVEAVEVAEVPPDAVPAPEAPMRRAA
jgi:hypothetical protein